MSNRVVRRIEEWFVDPDNEEDDFLRLRTANWIVSPTANSVRVIYCTKRHILETIFCESPEPTDVGVICRAGLPCDDDLVWLAALIRGRKLLFLGDMDPADLMIFAWLRARLPTNEVVHVGLNERLAKHLGYGMPANHRIPL